MEFNSPEWFGKYAVYQINPRTFSKDGTIGAVTRELPALQKMGFKIMYLCPVFKEDDNEDQNFWSPRQRASETGNPKNPYKMNDYFAIDDEYGTMADLAAFVARGHELGMKVILDLVYLHMGSDAGILKVHPEFAVREPDGSIRLNQWNFALLNYESEGLREYLFCNMAYYVGVMDVDGFRCDVGDGVPLDFWREGMRRIRAIKPDAIMINEGIQPTALSVFDANYGFYWHEGLYKFLAKETPASELISASKTWREKTPDGKFLMRDLENHDTVTDWPYRVEEKLGHDAMEAVLALNYTIDGVPMVYAGNELGDTAHLSMFANRFHPGVFETTDRGGSGPAVERRKQVVTRLNDFKANIPAFSRGSTEWYAAESESVMAFKRVTDEETIGFAGNFSDEPTEVCVDAVGEVLLSNGAEVCGDTVKLGAYGYVIFRALRKA